MRILDYLFAKKQPSAGIAKDRLRIVLAHERAANRSGVEFLPRMQKELIAVVAKYVEVKDEMVRINLGKQGNASILEINIEIDAPRKVPLAAAS